MKLAIVLTVPLVLRTCGEVGLPLDVQFPAVPPDIKQCAKRGNAALPDQDMSAHDVEINWKADRYNSVIIRQCLKRLIVRDQTLAGRK